jgi:hypothetical protein
MAGPRCTRGAGGLVGLCPHGCPRGIARIARRAARTAHGGAPIPPYERSASHPHFRWRRRRRGRGGGWAHAGYILGPFSPIPAGNRFTSEGVAGLAAGLRRNTVLTTLGLSRNAVGDRGAFALAAALVQLPVATTDFADLAAAAVGLLGAGPVSAASAEDGGEVAVVAAESDGAAG